MQDVQDFRELSDQDLEEVVGGGTFAGVSIGASATGGHFQKDVVFTAAQTRTISVGQESISYAFGFGVAIAI